MKLPAAFPLLAFLLLVFQEQHSSLSINGPASPGYYQDGDFIIGGLFSLRVTAGDTRSRFGFDNTFYITELVYA
jgi:vomeronasal 2 receptor